MKNEILTIDDALDFIYGFVDYSLTHARNVPANAFSLDKMEKLLSRLGNPQESFTAVHVAGTKGKGSVCAMLAAGLQPSGLKIGLYTSPHLIRFNERIQINGSMITDPELIALVNQIRPQIDNSDPPSSFEVMTAIAFEFFRQMQVDYAVIETGMGGRLDSTNVVKPLLSVITPISLDHTQFLGNSIPLIAKEKGGIIKSDVPVVVSAQPEEARTVLKQIADERNAEWIDTVEQYGWIPLTDTPFSQKIAIWEKSNQNGMAQWLEGGTNNAWSPAIVDLPLAGFHQTMNAATAYVALTRICELEGNLANCDIINGLGETFWPCRFEIIHENPLIVLDGAHNMDSMRKMILTMNRYYGTRKIVCLFGASSDKKCDEMIGEIAPFVESFVVTRSIHPRSADPEELGAIVSSHGRHAVICESLEIALETVLNLSEDTVVVATGSLFVAGGIRTLLMQQNQSLRYFK